MRKTRLCVDTSEYNIHYIVCKTANTRRHRDGGSQEKVASCYVILQCHIGPWPLTPYDGHHGEWCSGSLGSCDTARSPQARSTIPHRSRTTMSTTKPTCHNCHSDQDTPSMLLLQCMVCHRFWHHGECNFVTRKSTTDDCIW